MLFFFFFFFENNQIFIFEINASITAEAYLFACYKMHAREPLYSNRAVVAWWLQSTSYYIHMWVRDISLYSYDEKICKKLIKESSPKPFKILKIVLLWGLCLPVPPTRALPWTQRGLGGHLDPSPKLVPPTKGQCLDPALAQSIES